MSNKSKPSGKAAELLAAINRQIPPQEAPAVAAAPAQNQVQPEEPPKPQRKSPVSTIAEPKSRAGKPVQFWLRDDDKQMIREYSAWLAGQGERPSDSLVIRAVLRMAKTSPDFLKAYRHVSQMDGRLKQHKTA